MNVRQWYDIVNTYHTRKDEFKSQRGFLLSRESDPLTISNSSAFSRYYLLYCRGELSENRFGEGTKRMRLGKSPDIEKELVAYLNNHKSEKEDALILLTGEQVKAKVISIAKTKGEEFVPTDSWLNRLKKRWDVKLLRKTRTQKPIN